MAHRVDDVLGRANAHEVARPIGRKPRRRVGDQSRHVFLRLAHREAADGVAREAERHEARERLVAQVFIHAALHDPEERIRIALVRALRALRPAQR